ncbi:MFS general substrate transporter [Colletotrichum falcatum]|nr:MFS general substrate transporter [Colletotrichum falcatum]
MSRFCHAPPHRRSSLDNSWLLAPLFTQNIRKAGNEIPSFPGRLSPEWQARHAKLRSSEAAWNGSDDPDNPYNWPPLRKILISVIVSFGQLVTLMSTSMMAAAPGRISHDLGIDESITQVTFSIFILGLAFAPFPIASFSEVCRCQPIWLFVTPSTDFGTPSVRLAACRRLIVVGRFMAGSGASVGITFKSPIMIDMYRKEDRGKSLATFVPYFGPALGPMIGGIITQKLDWPWVFYLLSIFNAVIWVVGLFLVRKSYAPVLLARKRKAAAASSGASSPGPTSFWAAASKMAANLRRPMQLLWQRPIIQVIALIVVLNFGVYCILLSTFATLWINLTPVILISVGLLWYGWAAEVGAHWAVVDAGVAVFVFGSFLLAQAMLAYLIDEFSHAALGNAASRMLPNVLGFGNSMLAFLFIRLGCPVPLLLWVWGARLRALGRK